MRLLLVTMVISAAYAAGAPISKEVPQTLLGIVDGSPSVTFTRCPENGQIVAVYREREPQWWGYLSVYHRSGDGIDWEYSFPKAYEEFRGHYVVRFRWVTLRQTEKPVLEVIESTHMGNGSLRLWELDGKELRLLLDTEARGRLWSVPAAFGVPENGEAHFENDHLEVFYYASADQESDTVILSGSVRIEDVEGRALPSRAFEQSCLWDPVKRIFVAQEPVSP